MKLVRSFIYSAGLILLVAALERFLIVAGNARVLSQPEPMLGIPMRPAVLLVGGLELVTALICLFGKNIRLQIVWLAWLTTNFIVFQIGLFWIHCRPQASCIGSLTDPLILSTGATGLVRECILSFLVLGSFAALIWFWFSTEAKQARLAAARLHADQSDLIAGLLKALCPSCGGKVKFAAQNAGQQIPCPHCQAVITLHKLDKNLKISCFFCQEHIEFPNHAIGQTFACPHCKMAIILKEPT